MNIFELLSFDISEFFASTEGKLIIAGIICLIIGIVFLCMGNGKNKKGKKEIATPENNTTATSTPEVPSQNTVAETPIMNVENTPLVNQEPVVLNNNMNTNQVQNDANNNNTLIETPSASPVEPINFGTQDSVVPAATPTPTVTPEPFNFETPAAPAASAPVEKLEVTGTLPSMNNLGTESTTASVNPTPVIAPEPTVVQPDPTPVIEPEQVVTTPQVTPISTVPEPIEQPTVTVYGGANPEVPKADVLEEKPREIYGGANPLENTAPIPTNSVKEAYNGATITPISSTSNIAPEPTVVQPDPTPVATPEPAVTPVIPVQNQTISEPVPTPSVVSEPTAVQPVPTPIVTPEPTVAPTPVASTPTVQSTPMAPREEIERLEF